MNVRFSLLSIVCALVLGAFAPGAFAEGAPAASGAVTAPASAAELPYADGVTPQNAASADSTREMLKLVEVRSMIDRASAQMDEMMRRLPDEIAKGQTLNARQRQLVDDAMRRMRDIYGGMLSWETLEPMMVEIYRHAFTQAELDASMAFYRTPAGQSMIRKLPMVQQYSMQLMQQKMQTVVPELQAVQRQLVADLKAAADTPK